MVASIKLPKLPDRTPSKLTITVLPDLHQALQDYASAYAQVYGVQVSVADLIPAILADYLDGDRTFRQRQKGS